MGRKILFITTDQMRYDSLGCNGGTVARTPVLEMLLVDLQDDADRFVKFHIPASKRHRWVRFAKSRSGYREVQ